MRTARIIARIFGIVAMVGGLVVIIIYDQLFSGVGIMLGGLSIFISGLRWSDRYPHKRKD